MEKNRGLMTFKRPTTIPTHLNLGHWEKV